MEAKLFKQFKPVDDTATTTATTNLGTAKLHGEHTAALKADIANFNLFTSKLFARGGFNNCWTGLAAKQQ